MPHDDVVDNNKVNSAKSEKCISVRGVGKNIDRVVWLAIDDSGFDTPVSAGGKHVQFKPK